MTLRLAGAALAAFAFIATGPGVALAQDAPQPGELAAPVKLTANDGAISVTTGHSAPFLTDWDGDGTLDLLVGQFGSGQLRIYRNSGSNTEPKYTDFTYFDGKVPTG